MLFSVGEAIERRRREQPRRAAEHVLFPVEVHEVELGIRGPRRGDGAVDLHRAHPEEQVGAGAEVEVQGEPGELAPDGLDRGDEPAHAEFVAGAQDKLQGGVAGVASRGAGALLGRGEAALGGG